jgi:spore maturation protein CgeB
MWPGSTCVPRFNGLVELGLAVDVFDATPWSSVQNRLVNSIGQRAYCTPKVISMNKEILESARKSRPEVLWIEKGNWIFPSTLKELRRFSKYIVHYNTDDVFAPANYFWLHRLGIRYYDVFLTTNRWNVLELRSRYGVKVFRAGMGYDQATHKAFETTNHKRNDLVFIGHWEPHTEMYVQALIKSGADVKVWGHNWHKSRNHGFRQIRPLAYSEYVKVVSSAKIALCSLSRKNRNESTGRSFEIPAIGTMMLAEYTPEHDFIYGDGRGAVLFSNLSELSERAHYYLDNSTARAEVATAGHMISKEPGYSWAEHIRREWPIVERMLTQPGYTPITAEDVPFWADFRNGAPPPQAKKGSTATDG